MNPLTAEIATAQNSDNKLILIIGGPGSGKSKLIHDYAKDSNIDMLTFLKELAKKIIVVATWNGTIADNKLIHIRSKLPANLEYSLKNEQIKFIKC